MLNADCSAKSKANVALVFRWSVHSSGNNYHWKADYFTWVVYKGGGVSRIWFCRICCIFSIVILYDCWLYIVASTKLISHELFLFSFPVSLDDFVTDILCFTCHAECVFCCEIMEHESLACPSERGDQSVSPAAWNKKQNGFSVLMNKTSNFVAKRTSVYFSSSIYFEVHLSNTELSRMGLLLFWHNCTCGFVSPQTEMHRFVMLLASSSIGLIPVLSTVLLWIRFLYLRIFPICISEVHFPSWGIRRDNVRKKYCSLFTWKSCLFAVMPYFLTVPLQTTSFCSVKFYSF